MKHQYLLFVLLFLHTIPSAQTVSVKQANIDKVLFGGTFFSFSITPYIDERAKIMHAAGPYIPGANNLGGVELGGNFYINFNKSYSLVVGIHGGSATRNFTLHISKNDFSPALASNINFRGALTKDRDFYLAAPVWLEKRWREKTNNYWNINAGINVRYYPDDIFYEYEYGGKDVSENYVPVLDLSAEVSNNLKPWINYNIGGGYTVFLPNYNMLRLNLIANFSTTKLVNGDYTITVTGKPESTGTYSSKLSYVGISLGYIFTGVNKRLVRLYKSAK